MLENRTVYFPRDDCVSDCVSEIGDTIRIKFIEGGCWIRIFPFQRLLNKGVVNSCDSSDILYKIREGLQGVYHVRDDSVKDEVDGSVSGTFILEDGGICLSLDIQLRISGLELFAIVEITRLKKKSN